jgi:acyl carrier protein
MTTQEIELTIIETLKELEAGCGEPAYQMNATTVPLTDLKFFDSLLAIELSIALEEKFGCACNDGSFFSDKKTEKRFSISEIASHLAQLSKAAV